MSTASHQLSGPSHDGSNSPILDLSNELLRHILDFVEIDGEEAIQTDRQQFLAVESIVLPPHDHDFAENVGRFRCVCKRFADVGAPLLFARVAARFSRAGLERIKILAGWPHLACYVKKFSYMVPHFYVIHVEEARIALRGTRSAQVRETLRRLQSKINEQEELVESQDDVRILTKAIANFTSLQLVQLLRVADWFDNDLAAYIRQNNDSRPFDLDWTRACSHGSRTLGEALLASDVSPLRFSSPMLSPQSVRLLTTTSSDLSYQLASRLTGLTIHFDHGTAHLDQEINDLSPLFRELFTAAKNMQDVHVGFPSHRPISLPLESIFHNVTWEKLVTFGIQGWKLKADEIIHLATRYTDRLKGLRLREVYIKEGGMWQGVLEVLRARMHRLKWVSLVGIGYEKHFETTRPMSRAELFDEEEGTESTSGAESSVGEHDDSGESGNSDQDAPEHSNVNDDKWDDDEDSHSDAESEDTPANNDMELPVLDSPNTPVSCATWCNHEDKEPLFDSQSLGDDGVFVSTAKRKAWEKWVVGRRPGHSQE